MNERIGQLAEQAGLLGPSSRIGNAHEAAEKFAELIVQECISAVEDTNDRHRRDYFAAKIREHFGIEE